MSSCTRILADFVLLARDCHFIGFEDEDFSTVGGFLSETETRFHMSAESTKMIPRL